MKAAFAEAFAERLGAFPPVPCCACNEMDVQEARKTLAAWRCTGVVFFGSQLRKMVEQYF